MAVSLYQLKKWFRRYVLRSKKIVVQGVGAFYSKNEIKGFYNDLREKITKGDTLAENELPQYHQDNGTLFYFSIGIFQYGLGSYDLYLQTWDKKHYRKMLLCADWAVENQEPSGGWSTFVHLYPDHPYSSMAQGEGISLLLRAYVNEKDEKYLNAAKKAAAHMLTSLENGGTALREGDEIVLMEYTERPIVMNGWIFSLWGLYDYLLIVDDPVIKEEYEKSLATLERYIPHYDLGYWTRYDYNFRTASPSYHKLHIDQFIVMYELTGHEIFREYKERFEKYRDSWLCRNRAFAKKAFEKLHGR